MAVASTLADNQASVSVPVRLLHLFNTEVEILQDEIVGLAERCPAEEIKLLSIEEKEKDNIF